VKAKSACRFLTDDLTMAAGASLLALLDDIGYHPTTWR
jgi:hypothetical protein